MKKGKLRKILIVILLLLGLSFLGFSYYIGDQVVQGSTQLVTNDQTRELPDSFWSNFGVEKQAITQSYGLQTASIPSTFQDHMIPADLLFASGDPTQSDRDTVILVHGLGGNRESTYPIANFFLEAGYNVLAYDQRSSGENTAQYTTFGVWEKFDLIDCINYIKQRAPQKKLGIWGTSFGGATAGLAAGYEDTADKLDFMILDCPVGSMKWMIREEIKNLDTGLPADYLVLCGDLVNRLRFGFSYDDADVPEDMKKVELPVLVVNSKIDTVTPEFMGKDIFQAIRGSEKELWTVEDSSHANIWIDYPVEYRLHMTNLIGE